MSHQPNGSSQDDHDDKSVKDKFKNPMHELKEKLEHSHLHSLKVGLNHQKYVQKLPLFLPRAATNTSIDTKSGSSQTW